MCTVIYVVVLLWFNHAHRVCVGMIEVVNTRVVVIFQKLCYKCSQHLFLSFPHVLLILASGTRDQCVC